MASILKVFKLRESKMSDLTKAVRNKDASAARKAVSGAKPDDFDMTANEFRDLLQHINHMGQDYQALDHIKNMLGIGDENPAASHSTSTHNPVTNQPWSSGPSKTGHSASHLDDAEAVADEIDFFVKNSPKFKQHFMHADIENDGKSVAVYFSNKKAADDFSHKAYDLLNKADLDFSNISVDEGPHGSGVVYIE